MIRAATLAAALLLSTAAAHATELHLVAHTISAHSGQRTDQPGAAYNERNPGLGLRAQLTPVWSMQGGAYRNSYHRDSLYALADWTPLRAGPVAAGLFAGVVNNYPHNDHRIGVSGGLLLRAEAGRLSVVVRYVPKVSPKQSGHTGAVEFGWRL